MRRIFFIWLDPGAPLQAATASSKPMPDKYATNVARWRQRYGDDVVDVLDGAACLAAVQGVEAKGHCPGLTAQYKSFAHRYVSLPPPPPRNLELHALQQRAACLDLII